MLPLLVPIWQEGPLCILSPVELAVAPSRGEPSARPRREMNSAEPSPASLQELGGLVMECGGDWRGHMASGGTEGVEREKLGRNILPGDGEERDDEGMGTMAYGGGTE